MTSSKRPGRVADFVDPMFRSCVIDPPWPYKRVEARSATTTRNNLSGYVSKAGVEEYDTLSIDDLASLPIQDLVSGYLFLWITGPFLPDGFTLLDAWGFEYATSVTWVKKTRTGKTPYGAGYWYRGAAETILIARRSGVPSIRTQTRNVFEAERRNHSAKPEIFQDHVEACYPGPYLELFARRQRPGWTCLGNEAPGDGRDIRTTMAAVLNGSFPVDLSWTEPAEPVVAVDTLF